MYLEIKIPSLRGRKTLVTIFEWHKRLGDTVRDGDVLVSVLHAGTRTQVRSTVSGILVNQRVNVGEAVFTAEVIAVIRAIEGQDRAKDRAGADPHGRRSEEHTGSQSQGAVDAASWHRVLEVSITASLADIRAAYRGKILKFHPDKVISQDPLLREQAETYSKELNRAYAEARKVRGR